MKAILVILLFSSVSQAIVADRFKCKIEVVEDSSGLKAKDEKEFFMARLPLSISPAPDVRLTRASVSSEVSLLTPKARYSAELTFYYKHAVKVDANGSALEGRQLTCINLMGGYCENKPNWACAQANVACWEPPPFDLQHGWTPVAIVNGEPLFQHPSYQTVSIIHDDQRQRVGTASATCEYNGTYQ